MAHLYRRSRRLTHSVLIPALSADYQFTETVRGRVAARLGLSWDAYDAYLFDIDGTLLRDPARIHSLAFSKACQAVLGHPLPLDSVHIAGSTDPRILRDAFTAAGIPDETWRPRRTEILAALCDAVSREADRMQITLMPAVDAALDHLAARGKCLGVATGNLEAVGWLKLGRAGLRHRFAFGGFSSARGFSIAHEDRAALIAAAAATARVAAGPRASLAIVGDTPSDIAAAHANGLPVIAIATGRSSFDELLGHVPEICADSLAALLAPAPSPNRAA